jgi:hypothetical protein
MSAQLTTTKTQPEVAEPEVAVLRPPRRGAWRWVRQTIQEMNYGARRFVEWQAPWIVDKDWHRH